MNSMVSEYWGLSPFEFERISAIWNACKSYNAMTCTCHWCTRNRGSFSQCTTSETFFLLLFHASKALYFADGGECVQSSWSVYILVIVIALQLQYALRFPSPQLIITMRYLKFCIKKYNIFGDFPQTKMFTEISLGSSWTKGCIKVSWSLLVSSVLVIYVRDVDVSIPLRCRRSFFSTMCDMFLSSVRLCFLLVVFL